MKLSVSTPRKMPTLFYKHPTSEVHETASVGSGTKIWHFSHVMDNVVIGKNCVLGQNVFVASGVSIGNGVKIQNNVSLYEGVVIEEKVFLGPSCVFTNVNHPRSFVSRRKEFETTRVCAGASIGANATIVCGHSIGRYAFIGAGALVADDVPDYALVYGVPARLRGWVCECGEKLSFKGKKADCKRCSKTYEKQKKGVRWCGH